MYNILLQKLTEVSEVQSTEEDRLMSLAEVAFGHLSVCQVQQASDLLDSSYIRLRNLSLDPEQGFLEKKGFAWGIWGLVAHQLGRPNSFEFFEQFKTVFITESAFQYKSFLETLIRNPYSPESFLEICLDIIFSKPLIQQLHFLFQEGKYFLTPCLRDRVLRQLPILTSGSDPRILQEPLYCRELMSIMNLLEFPLSPEFVHNSLSLLMNHSGTRTRPGIPELLEECSLETLQSMRLEEQPGFRYFWGFFRVKSSLERGEGDEEGLRLLNCCLADIWASELRRPAHFYPPIRYEDWDPEEIDGLEVLLDSIPFFSSEIQETILRMVGDSILKTNWNPVEKIRGLLQLSHIGLSLKISGSREFLSQVLDQYDLLEEFTPALLSIVKKVFLQIYQFKVENGEELIRRGVHQCLLIREHPNHKGFLFESVFIGALTLISLRHLKEGFDLLENIVPDLFLFDKLEKFFILFEGLKVPLDSLRGGTRVHLFKELLRIIPLPNSPQESPQEWLSFIPQLFREFLKDPSLFTVSAQNYLGVFPENLVQRDEPLITEALICLSRNNVLASTLSVQEYLEILPERLRYYNLPLLTEILLYLVESNPQV